MNAGLRAGTDHTRPTGTACERARGKFTNACNTAVVSSAGVVTVAVVTPASRNRARNASCRSPNRRSTNSSREPSLASSSRNISRGIPASLAAWNSNSV